MKTQEDVRDRCAGEVLVIAASAHHTPEGFIAHLVFGLAVTATSETVLALT